MTKTRIIIKTTASIIFLAIVVAGFSMRANALCGDVDGSGSVNSTDLLMVARASLGILTLSSAEQLLADVTSSGTPDGTINSTDLLWVARASLGLATLSCNESTCGNGDVEDGEQCDDGNTNSGDGCSSTCQTDGIYWSKTYAGDHTQDSRSIWSIRQTSDGGYIATGSSYDYSNGDSDPWVIKIDESGNEIWKQSHGTINATGRSIIQVSDGNYVFSGIAYDAITGQGDFWIVKLDTNGTMLWEKKYGGANGDSANSIVQTSDGGYIVTGDTYSYGAGSSDVWLVKLASDGSMSWDKTHGGTSIEHGYSVWQTTDGGYVVAGSTKSSGAGGSDFYILRLDLNGDEVWNKVMGDIYDDAAYSIQQTVDGGFIVTGSLYSVTGNAADVWLVKLDAGGNETWSTKWEGNDTDIPREIQQTTDGGFIVGGRTESINAQDDFLIIKYDSSGTEVWKYAYGGSGFDVAYTAQQTSDGGYIIAGGTESYSNNRGDFWVIKLDSLGNCNGCFN